MGWINHQWVKFLDLRTGKQAMGGYKQIFTTRLQLISQNVRLLIKRYHAID